MYPVYVGLFSQFLEDLLGIELEKYLKENNVGKWFYDFKILDPTPTFILFDR